MVGVCRACAQGAARAEEAACSLLAARGDSSTAAQTHASVAAETKIARQDFIARSLRETRIVSHRGAPEPETLTERQSLTERQIFTRHHSSLHGRRDIWR